MKKLIYKIWDNRELLLAILLSWAILLIAMLWVLPNMVKASIYTGIEAGRALSTEGNK